MLPSQSRNKDLIKLIINGKTYIKQVILDDVNMPYKLSMDRNTNTLFFCINADEFSEQSFHSVFLDLDKGSTAVIPRIKDGFASAVDQDSNTVYLGGSDGVYKFNYTTKDIVTPALIKGFDIFDMFYSNDLYFVDTGNQDVYVYKDSNKSIIQELKGMLVHHLVVNSFGDLVFMSSLGLFVLPKGARNPMPFESIDINVRGATTDVNGIPHFIAQDGIYSVDVENKQLTKILPLENGYGLAFDKYNNIIYSDERTVNKLIVPTTCHAEIDLLWPEIY